MAYETSTLTHHGIKGMKWGRRRFQNADGSLTPAGEKRYQKNLAYRDKLASKAQRNAESYRTLVKDSRANIRDLKKNGVNSQAYKDYKAKLDAEREERYERENSITDNDGNVYSLKYRNSGERFTNDFMDRINASTAITKLIAENEHEINRGKKMADHWEKNNSDLMNMDVSVLTKKREIRRTYRGTNRS